ncbi:MAG: phosphoribosylglycinamide formyltransferase [Hyphomicrobiaceae bacterium]
MKKLRVGVLISGRGSNMVSLIDAARAPDYPAEIVTVISNRPTAGGLKLAQDAGIPTVVIDHKQYATRMAFEAKLHLALLDAGVELICSAGFMRMLTGGFVDRWKNRQLNIHPSLLPAFPGLDTHERALREGVRIHGCTVHFVRLEMDTGPIVAQAAVAVLAGDTPDTLAARVLEAEHKLYPHALRLVASGAVRVSDEEIRFAPPTDTPAPLFSPALKP